MCPCIRAQHAFTAREDISNRVSPESADQQFLDDARSNSSKTVTLDRDTRFRPSKAIYGETHSGVKDTSTFREFSKCRNETVSSKP
jgi:hypothetical protein